jgi:hypothetical protein
LEQHGEALGHLCFHLHGALAAQYVVRAAWYRQVIWPFAWRRALQLAAFLWVVLHQLMAFCIMS